MVRSPSSTEQTAGLKKGPWTSDEDQILTNHINFHGHPNWRALPRLAGLARCGKSCRLRWTNYLQPGIKRGNFTREEEETIINSHELLGNRWSAIAAKLPGRTDNEIKNVWHTHLKKRLLNNNQNQPQGSTASIGGSHNNRSDDVIIIDESLFHQARDDHSNTNPLVQHAHADRDDQNPNDAPACNTHSHTIHVPSISPQDSYGKASYNNCEQVPSPEAFPETDESFWSDVLSSDYDYRSGSSSMKSYYTPCHQQPFLPVSDNSVVNMEMDYPQEAAGSSFPDVPANNVNNNNNAVQDGDDVDDFWFDVLFRAGEHPILS
uniref:Uncharacterized protein n=1 Tax=Kalanchoe fedtschenkoi TaxID=63787 RepID=A0A7N0TUL9_KALFE